MPSHHTIVVLYDAVALTAMILFVCSFLPAIFSRGVQRSLGWYSLMTGWLVYTALLVYAVPALVSTSMVCYCIEFYLIISGIRTGTLRQPKTVVKFVLCIVPWLIFLAIIIEVLLFAYVGKSHVLRAYTGFYCHLETGIPNTVTASTVLTNAVILLPLEIWTGIVMYRNWEVFKRLERADCQLILTVYLRLMVCTLAAVLAFAFSTLDFVLPKADNTGSIPIVYPTLPIFIAFSFGTQKDVLRAWIFWKPSEPSRTILYTSGNMITTNIYTAGVTVADTLTSSEMQSIEPKDHPPAGSIKPVISSSMSSQTIQNVNRGTSSYGIIHLDLPKDGTVSKLGTGS